MKTLTSIIEIKTFDEIPEPDIAVSMGCDVDCPYIGRGFDEKRGLPDPTGESDEVFIEVIKQIEERIIALREKVRSMADS